MFQPSFSHASFRSAETGKSLGAERKIVLLRLKNHLAQNFSLLSAMKGN
jgi:hypothetical protein